MEEKGISFSSLKDVSVSQLDELSKKRIYFGHMSVGYNIIDGIRDILKENPELKMNIIETKDPSAMAPHVFAHSSVGKNMDPKSKVDDFVQSMESGLGQKVDAAFFKFCFVDIEAATNVEELFSLYKNAMSKLQGKYPKVTFIHVTVPLTTVQTGWKAPVKRIIGKPIEGYQDNIKRNQFNDLIRQEYSGREPVFDLAGIESSALDGRRASFTSNDKIYCSLMPSYTFDGGHLNEKGRKVVAEQLLILLATVSK